MTSIGTVTGVNRFAVKSMQGESPEEVDVDHDGVVGDREWALRDVETGKLVSAKRPRLWRAALDCHAAGTGDDTVVTLPSGDEFAIRDPALEAGLEALFGRAVTVERATHAQQGVYESDWPEIDGLSLAGEIDFVTNLTGEGTSFIDVGILHVLTTTSMKSVQTAVPTATIDERRFRPSIVVDTPDLDGFPENDWSGRSVRIGEVELALGDPTPRCVMTTVDQPDLERDPAILRAIARENRVTNELGAFACLGCYATVTTPGTIRVGATVTML